MHKNRFAYRIITRLIVSVWLFIGVPLRLAATWRQPYFEDPFLTLAQITTSSSKHLMLGDSGRKVSILAGDFIGRCEKKNSIGTCVWFGMFTEIESCFEVYKYKKKNILNINKEREIALCCRLLWPCIMNLGWRGRNQQDATNLMFIIKLYLNMFRASLCPSSEEQECALPHMVFCTLEHHMRQCTLLFSWWWA